MWFGCWCWSFRNCCNFPTARYSLGFRSGELFLLMTHLQVPPSTPTRDSKKAQYFELWFEHKHKWWTGYQFRGLVSCPQALHPHGSFCRGLVMQLFLSENPEIYFSFFIQFLNLQTLMRFYYLKMGFFLQAWLTFVHSRHLRFQLVLLNLLPVVIKHPFRVMRSVIHISHVTVMKIQCSFIKTPHKCGDGPVSKWVCPSSLSSHPG